MSFVAAHWTDMSKLARLALLLATLWACYGARGLPVRPPARRLRACRRARRHRRLRRRHHADRADVPHGGQPARRGAVCGRSARCWPPCCCAPTRRWPPPSCCSSCGPGWERILNETAHWGVPAAVGGSRRGRGLARAGGPACISPRSASRVWLVPLGFFVLDRHAHWLVAADRRGGGAGRRRRRPRHRPPAVALRTRSSPTASPSPLRRSSSLQFIDDVGFFDAHASAIGRPPPAARRPDAARRCWRRCTGRCRPTTAARCGSPTPPSPLEIFALYLSARSARCSTPRCSSSARP